MNTTEQLTIGCQYCRRRVPAQPLHVCPQGAYGELGGSTLHWPLFNSKPAFTRAGNPYFQKPGVTLLSKPSFAVGQLYPFLEGFDESLGFCQYVGDSQISVDIYDGPTPTELCDGLTPHSACLLLSRRMRVAEVPNGGFWDVEDQRHVDRAK